MRTRLDTWIEYKGQDTATAFMIRCWMAGERKELESGFDPGNNLSYFLFQGDITKKEIKNLKDFCERQIVVRHMISSA